MKYISVLVFIFLLLCSFFDIRTKQIPIAVIIIFGIIVLPITWVKADPSGQTIWINMIPGAVFLAMGFVSKQAVGYGDGMVILLLGILLGIHLCFLMVFIGLLLCSAVSVWKIIAEKADRQAKLPYTPFLLTAWGVITFGMQ